MPDINPVEMNLSDFGSLTQLTFDKRSESDTFQERTIQGGTAAKFEDDKDDLDIFSFLPDHRQPAFDRSVDDNHSTNHSMIEQTPDEIGKPAYKSFEPVSNSSESIRSKYVHSLLMGEQSFPIENHLTMQIDYPTIAVEDNNDSKALSDEIDHKIDEALAFAHRMIAQKNSEDGDDLDVPAFLRNGMREVPLD
jgi:hypothetical protein